MKGLEVDNIGRVSLAQMDKLLCKSFTAVCSEGKPVSGLVIIYKPVFFIMK